MSKVSSRPAPWHPRSFLRCRQQLRAGTRSPIPGSHTPPSQLLRTLPAGLSLEVLSERMRLPAANAPAGALRACHCRQIVTSRLAAPFAAPSVAASLRRRALPLLPLRRRHAVLVVRAADRDDVTDVSDILRKYGSSSGSGNGDGLKPAGAFSWACRPRASKSAGMVIKYLFFIANWRLYRMNFV